MSNRRKIPAVALAACIALPSIPAVAQIEEVIVTARKREESILKVPVIATAIGREQLEKFSVSDLQGISDRVPGLLVGSGTLSFGNQVSMRGLGTSTLSNTIEQSVSLNIDGMQMTQGLAYAAGMYDVEQVEVLKGPQALFFGKASPAGVISVTTAGPGNELELILRHGYETEAEENRTDFIASGPLTDTLGVRLAATYADKDGYFTNKARPHPDTGARAPDVRGISHKEEWLVRGTVEWEPVHRLRSRLKLNAMRSDADGDGGSIQMASCPDGVTAPAGIPFLGGGEDCKMDDVIRIVDMDPAAFPTIRNGGSPFGRVSQHFGTLELNYDFWPELTLTSVTGFYDLEQEGLINGFNTTHAGPPLAVDTDFRREELTQELRLTSSFDPPLNFMVGAFYQDGRIDYTNNLLGNTALSVGPDEILNLPGGLRVGEPGRVIPLPAQLQKGFHIIDIKAVSAFGQLLWDITPELELAVGARWTDEERRHEAWDTLSGTAERIPTAVPKLSTSDLSPEVTLTYTPTDDFTAFGAVKRAFKSGSFDVLLVPVPGEDVSFGEEQITGGELGIKSHIFGRSLRLDLAGYYYVYDDLQVGAVENTPEGQIVLRTVTASAEVYGFDIEGSYASAAIPGLGLYGALNYNKAEYDEFDDAPCWGGQLISEGCNRRFNPETERFTAQDLSGAELMRAPAWQANVGLDYETAVWNGMTLVVGWNTTYSSAYLTNILDRDDMEQEGYFKHNASAALRSAKGAWELALIANNLADKLTTGNCVNANFANAAVYGGTNTGGTERGPAGVDELGCNVDRGRSIWLRLSLNLSGFL